MEKSNYFDFHSCPRYPLEMHIVYFKAKYIYYEEAAKYDDGVIFEVHFFYIQEDINERLSPLIGKLSDVHRSGTSVAVEECALARYVTIFVSDYFLYGGTIIAGEENQKVTWIISRQAYGISNSQMNEFRQLLGQDGFPLIRNSYKIYEIGNRKIYHVNGSDHAKEILYPFPKILHKKTEKLRIRFRFKPSSKVIKLTGIEQNKRKQEMKKNVCLQTIEVDTINESVINNKSRIADLEEQHNEHIEPVLGRRNIIDSVVQWLRNSVLQNKEEMTSLYETTEIEKETYSTKETLDTELSTEAATTKISGPVDTLDNNVLGLLKKQKKMLTDFSIEITNSLKSADFQPVERIPRNTFCKSNFNGAIVQNKIHRKNKVKLFSDLESNFTQQVMMNKNKLESDGLFDINAHEGVSLYTKSTDALKKRMIQINSKQCIKSKGCKKEKQNDLGKKSREVNDRAQSSETLEKSLIAGFKNIYFKYKNYYDNRNSSNVINKPELQDNNKKEDKACGTERKEAPNELYPKIKGNHWPVRGEKKNFKGETSDIERGVCNNGGNEYSPISLPIKYDNNKTRKNKKSKQLYNIEQDKKRKLKNNRKQLSKNIDILTPLKLDFDFLPKNFKDINDLKRRKSKLLKKSKHRKEADIVCNDSVAKKHKRTQTLNIPSSSSSESKNIIYISNRPKKNVMLRSNTSISNKVKFENKTKQISNQRITKYKRGTRNDFKFGKNKEKCTFGDVKVKKTSSHESVYIFIKKSIDNLTDSKKKPGLLCEWLLSARDLITGPKP